MDQKRRNRVKKLVTLLSSSSPNEKFNSLVEIRKNVLKSREGISLLSEYGGIPKIIQILDNENVETKTVDIALSILGNLCMDNDARKVVKKANGIDTVANVFVESEEESIQNRSSRTLANLALTHENIGFILKTDAVEKLAKLLQSSETKENLLTYSRTARLLASNARQLEKLLSENIILHLAKHLQNSDDEVKFSVLRSVFELSTVSCSPGFASQIVSSGILPDLLLLLNHHDDTVIHQSVTLIHRLSHQPNFRPGLGSAGGITTILELFQKEENLIDKNILLNILCMCCKESVNRIRIRDNGILQVFLACLSNDKLSPLHDKLISAIQCFVYYDASISLLLENGLVNTLIKHLQRVAGFQSAVCSVEDLIPTFIKGDQIIQELKTDQEFFQRLYQLPLQGHYTRRNLRSQKISKNIERCRSVDDIMNQEICEEITEEKQKPIYSIDSPTYIAHSNWDLDEYTKGNKCKQIFSKTSPDTDYSILSTMSYFTPQNSPSSDGSPASSNQYISSPSNFSFSSPGCSSWSGNESSPEHLNSGSTVNRDPKYGMVCSIAYACDSPVKCDSPMELSLINSPAGFSHTEEFSSSNSDDEELVNDVSKNKMEQEQNDDRDYKWKFGMEEEIKVLTMKDITAFNGVKITVDQPDETMESVADRDISAVPEQGKQETKPSKMKRSSEDENESSSENPAKRQKLCSPDQDCKISNRAHDTEIQILILLSRVSQMNDPSLYLVTMETIFCLLDYLTKVNNPQQRAARILSRIAKNPLCFEKLLKIRFILLVYYKLTLYKYEDEVNELAQTDNCVLQRSGVKERILKHRSSSLGLDRNEPVYSFLEDVKQSTDSNKSNKDIKALKQGLRLSGKDYNIVSKNLDENSNFKARVGLTLLQDMCIQADSYFGRGEVEHMRHQNPEIFSDWLPVDLIYVLWLSGMQDYYFSKLNFLENVLEVVQQNEATKKYQAAVQGLSFLGKMVNLHMKSEMCHPEDNFTLYQTNDCIPTEIMDTDEKKEEMFCNFRSLKISNKVEFLVENKRLVCCRDVLSKSCPLFTAMLHGEFLESNQDTVLIEDTSFYAFQYLVHYLHNCSLKCEVINNPLTCDITKESVNNCLEVFSLALKYMIGSLQSFLLSVLSKQLMSADTACHIFHFALLHDFSDLADDSVICVTKKGDNLIRMKGFCKFLYGVNREAFVMTLKDIFRS